MHFVYILVKVVCSSFILNSVINVYVQAISKYNYLNIQRKDSFDVVFPRIVHREILQNGKNGFQSSNTSKESSRQTSNLKIRLNSKWVVELNNFINITAEDAVSDWMPPTTTNNEKIVSQPVAKCQHGVGTVQGRDSSKAIISVCGNEYNGYVAVDNDEYFLESEDDGTHIFYKSLKHNLNRYKRSAPEENAFYHFNLTNDMDFGDMTFLNNQNNNKNDCFDFENDEEKCTVRDNNLAHLQSTILKWKDTQKDDDIGYFFDTAWNVQSIQYHKIQTMRPKSRWLKIAVAVDQTVITFHGHNKVEKYVLALMNIVNAIYQDSSLDSNMNLIVTRLILYDNKKQSHIIRSGNAKKSLENVNKWNENLHKNIGFDETRHDVAVWLTRQDLGGPSGYAPVGGTCDFRRSCALTRDEGLSSAFIIAHEVGHILGLTHDGDQHFGNKCNNSVHKETVMAPMVLSSFQKFSWSKCSYKEFRRHVKKWSCLLTPPKGMGEITLNNSLLNIFSMDEQCRMEFGEGFFLCRAFDIVEPCSHLWCGHSNSPLVCKTKKSPPLEGTECGFGKWCIDGYCEDMGQRNISIAVLLNPQNGGWGDWTLWGQCSRTCGIGVKFRNRKCDNPIPLYGGNLCQGPNEEWKICNNGKCPEQFTDLRAEQCKRLPDLFHFLRAESDKKWLPYEVDNIKKKCKLICIAEGTREIYKTSENLIDGTPCSYENDHDICIQGVCQPLGCDGKMHSKLKLDSCGICGGNNSNCLNISSIITRTLKKDVTRVAVLPRLSREITVKIDITVLKLNLSAAAFILKNRRKKKYSVTIPNSGYSGIIEGTKFLYEKTENHHSILAKGPLLAEMILLIYTPASEVAGGISITVNLNYTIIKDALAPSKRYIWIEGGWGPCSASCGTGKQQKTTACWDDLNKKLVRRKLCSLLMKPSPFYRKCNTFDCNFEWVAGKWEPCSATCGKSGIQHRELYCLPKSALNLLLFQNNSTFINEPWRLMVIPKRCSGSSPAETRPCNRVPCFVYWEYQPWKQCSSYCGNEQSSRTAICKPPINETIYTCGNLPPIEYKRCSEFSSNYLESKCIKQKTCLYDQSTSCFPNLFKKFCKIDQLKKLCCQTCGINNMIH